MDKKPFVSVLDLLLRPDLPDVRRELPEKRVEVKRLSRLAGEPVVFRLKALTYDQTRRVQDKPRGEQAVEMVLLGCTEPNWRAPGLLDPAKNIATPIDAIKAKLTAGEIDELAVDEDMKQHLILKLLEELPNFPMEQE